MENLSVIIYSIVGYVKKAPGVVFSEITNEENKKTVDLIFESPDFLDQT